MIKNYIWNLVKTLGWDANSDENSKQSASDNFWVSSLPFTSSFLAGSAGPAYSGADCNLPNTENSVKPCEKIDRLTGVGLKKVKPLQAYINSDDLNTLT